MRRMLFGLAVGLLTFAGSAWADGPIVRWDRVEGFGAVDWTQIHVGPIWASRGRTVGGGTVMLNLKTGFLSFSIRGMSNANQYANGPLGAAAGGLWMGTVVCDSTERFGPFAFVDSEAILLKDGTGSFQGFVVLPEGCKQRPEEMVFLIRHANPGPLYGGFVAFGAGRHIP